MTPPDAEAPARSAPRRRRARTTSARVRWTDRAATFTITLGGASVILAVLGILVYLVIVVRPLFAGASLSLQVSYPLLAPDEAKRVLFAEVDEYRTLGICLLDSGEAVTFSAATGEVLGRRMLFPGSGRITAFSRAPAGAHTAFGFDDGTVRLTKIAFEASLSAADGAAGSPPESAAAAEPAPLGQVTTTLPNGDRRSVTADLSSDEPVSVGNPGSAVSLLDYRAGDSESRLAVLKSDSELLVGEITRRTNMLTGLQTNDLTSYPVLVPPDFLAAGTPAFLRLTSRGDQLYLARRDGALLRYDLSDPTSPALVERMDFTSDPDSSLTAFQFVIGEQSILSADSKGQPRVWFRVARQGAGEDGYAMVPAHTLAPHAAPVTVTAGSTRDKSLLTGTADGTLALHHMTTERKLAEARMEPASEIVAAQIAPKGNGVFLLTADGRGALWDLANPHPETNLSAIFSAIWYEGYPEPSYTWQSSSGTDDFEPKLSLIPLIFGTFKATLYSMLFAVPIALCAAIYTAEFLDRRWRAPIKSAVEMMASLPSVVLGFLAALVLAPLVESWVLAVLLAFGVIPVLALALGYIWQLLPARLAVPLAGKPQFAILLVAVLLAVFGARLIGPVAEGVLFEGDFRSWLDGRSGTGAPGLGLLAWPPIALLLLLIDRRYLAEWLGRRGGRASGGAGAARDFVKYLGLLLLSFLLAWLFAAAGAALGLDPRESLLGTYVQRNALVVGFVMGFAVIPIIYTITEDALSSVPQSLRSASLGCGATRWQTATRVVLPVAASGIFSALMVGLGRAVGETMIVLMAAGNTPLIDLNIFNGMRTLSANIAVELPEAVKDGTLYRILFLAALILFLMTFGINTLAEVIRQRFRKKAYQL